MFLVSTTVTMDFMFGEEDKVGGHDDANKAIKFIQRIQQIHEAV